MFESSQARQVKLITQSELGRIVGLSRQAIRDAKLNRKIMMDGMNPKMVQLDHELTRHYIESRQDKREGKAAEGIPLGQEAAIHPGKKRQKTTKKQSSAPKRRTNTQVLALPDENVGDPAEDNSDTPLEEMGKHKLDTVKVYHEVLKLKVTIEEKRRKLVSIDGVFMTWAEFYAVHTAELGPLGEKISADLAAHFGVDDPELILGGKKKIDEPIYAALANIQRLMNDFLEAAGHKGRIE